jgi:hypothetical protein
MKYTKIREEEQRKVSELNHSVGLFWAFSNKQFEESKTPLKEGEKYVSIGMGGYLPKGNVDKWLEGMKAIEKWVKEAKKDAKEVILYELNNYECFYTGDITDAMPRLEELGYTREEVKKVYHANREFAIN